jgi:hypothetical protein
LPATGAARDDCFPPRRIDVAIVSRAGARRVAAGFLVRRGAVSVARARPKDHRAPRIPERAEDLIRPVCRVDGRGDPQNMLVLQRSPPAGVFAIWRRPSATVTKSGVDDPQVESGRTIKRGTPNDIRRRGRSPAGTKRVRQYRRHEIPVVSIEVEPSAIAGKRWSFDAPDIPPPLDRTQEVGGSSPPSSIDQSPRVASIFIAAHPCLIDVG